MVHIRFSPVVGVLIGLTNLELILGKIEANLKVKKFRLDFVVLIV